MSEKTQLRKAIENLNAELDEIESSIGILAGRTEGFTEQVVEECDELETKLEKLEKAVEKLNSKVDNGKITRT